MKKNSYLLLVFIFASIQAAYCQGKQPRLISGVSGYKNINTFPFFEVEPEPKKEKNKNVEETKKEAVKITKPEVAAVPLKLNDAKPVKEIKAAPKTEANSFTTIYFDQKQHKQKQPDNAYYYRKAKFDQTGNQPKGTVTDFYVNGDKPKFVGQFKKYQANYEEKNTEYDGLCKFYKEDGSYAIKIYVNNRVKNEVRYTANNEKTAEIEYTSDGKRKKYSEYVFDDSGKKIGDVDGALNSQTGHIESKERIFYTSNQIKSEKDFIDDCPTNKATLYKENGEKYDVHYQDFTCAPNGSWKFSNQSYFSTTHDKDSKAYKIIAQENKVAGIFQLPIKYDFYNKSFEIVAVFDLAGERPMSEFGIVWEFQDMSNYSYVKINTVDKTFEINAIQGGKPKKYMDGMKPQPLDINGSQVTITLRKTDNERIYTLNNVPLQSIKSNAAVNFNKFPLVSSASEFKLWGMGFYFKSNVINEKIILKSLEVKLL